MAKAKLGQSEVDTEFGADLIEGLKEIAAWKRGEVSLEVRRVEPMPASRVRQIRKSVAKSAREFERQVHISARTLEGWEQGRAVDATARVLLTVIEKNPEAVERGLTKS